MNYYLEYMPKALKKWDKLDSAIKKQFVNKLKDEEIIVFVLSVGKRENNLVYNDLEDRSR